MSGTGPQCRRTRPSSQRATGALTLTKLKLTLLASAATLALSGPVLAAKANKMTAICKDGYAWCAYDTGGNLLGVLQQVNILWREAGSVVRFIGYTAAGLTKDLTLFYESTNCTGQPYQQSGYINADLTTAAPNGPPAWAQWDGTNFWSTIGPAEVNPNIHSNVCYGVVCNGNPEGQCEPVIDIVAPGYPAYSPAAVVETPHLVTPSAACVAAQDCVVIK